MKEVAMKMFTWGLLDLCLVVGCSPHVPTLDEEIANQPDGRIRLVTVLQERFRHSPEWLLTDCG